MSSPSSPSRREFFKRAGTTVAAAAVVATPFSLFAQKPKVWKDEDGVHVDGDNVTLKGMALNSVVHIKAKGTVHISDSHITANVGPAGVGLYIEANNPIPPGQGTDLKFTR